MSEIEAGNMTGAEVAKMTLIRPFSLTFTEPIVLAIDLYIGLVYAVLYSYFESFPIVYGEGGYGWSLGVSMLPFAALLVGAILAYTGYCLWNRYVLLRFTFSFGHPLTSCRFYFEKKYHENQHNVAPEARLPMSMVGAICFPVSLFWFAWSSNRTHWIVPVISAVPFGMGMTWM